MATRRKVDRAKQRFLAEAADRDWLQGVGIGLVDKELGLIVSVQPRAKAAARRMLQRLELDVPVTLRGIEEIRAREPRNGEAEDESLESLRQAARARLDSRRR